MFRRMRSALHVSLWLFLVTALGLSLAPAAHAVQASGSISLIPDEYWHLAVVDGATPGADVFVKVLVNNTSSDTPTVNFSPNEDTDPLPATLTKNIIVTLACDDNECTMPRPGALQFLGCDMAVAGVTCTPLGTNQVQINVPAGGVALPAGTKPVNNGVLSLVRLHLKVLVTKQQVDNNEIPQTYMHAMTDGLGISTISSQTMTPISCALDGCTILTYTGGGMFCQKRLHQPAARVTFNKSGLDLFELAVGFVNPKFPIANGDQLTVELIQSGVTLFPPATTDKPPFLQMSGGKFIYNNITGLAGIYHVDIQPPTPGPQILNLKALEDLDMKLVPGPVLIKVTIAGLTIPITGTFAPNVDQPNTKLDLELTSICPKVQ